MNKYLQGFSVLMKDIRLEYSPHLIATFMIVFAIVVCCYLFVSIVGS